jgi:hypothetical protein
MSIQSPFLVKYSLIIPEFDNDDKNSKDNKNLNLPKKYT